MLRVGLTGGIGSGKTAVTDLLDELGAVVVDADVLAREVVAPGSEGLAEIVRAFGSDVLAESGALDRPAMARRVFGDDEARRRLEAIIHPRVRRRAAEIEASADGAAIVVHAIPLLVETGQAGRFDQVVVIDVPEELQMRRLTRTRDMDEEEARSRIAAQASRQQRLAVADIVIDNSGSLDDLRREVTRVFAQLSRQA
jgi:dephospho-CoA kinase